ncbi:LOW QUALITY PROTEIN: structural maintenance of chromosomes protein 5-like [Scylla paramamosain]|uniref:LOW QUALITY PROTEIN: structural maintenance of chromosomes protein 5-like n=1 Tax=Scylla paramamosain TaxID=85552 RepID=UPI0030833F26
MAPKSEMDFKTGNICRIYVKDFLTFNEVEVRPKPRLNLICGPNGSGKSSILSAICLCLGGKAQVMGRSKEVFDYVKVGKPEAILEVELFVQNQINVVLTHKISSATRKRAWFMQGKEVTHKTAMTRIEELNIQVDNLCQFLPQDRVVAFAKMNRQELLVATEKAVGDPSLHSDHQMLCCSGQLLLKMQNKIKRIEKCIAQAERRSVRLKDVVDNIEVKQKLEKELEDLKTQQAWYMYDLKRKIHQQHKEKVDEAVQELITLKERMNPTIQKIKEKSAVLTQTKKIVHSRTQLIRKNQDTNETLRAQSDNLADKVKDACRHFAAQETEEQERRTELKDYQRQLDVLLGQLQNLPEMNEKEVAQRLKELTDKIHKSSQKIVHLQGETAEVGRAMEQKKGLIQAHKKELLILQDVTGQRMQMLRSYNKDAFRATQWLQNNRDSFNGLIYPPICALLNVKNQQYACYVENRIMERDLVAFVCEDKDDVNRLKDEMDRLKMCVNIVYSNPAVLTNYKPPLPIQQLRKYGFETYMLDCVEAPPAVLSFLCQNYSLHRIPIGRAGDYDAVPLEISIFYLDKHRYSHIASRYDGQVSTSIFPVGGTKLLQIILDQDKITELKGNIERLEIETSEEEEQLKGLREEEGQLSKSLEAWRNEKRALSSRKEERRMLAQRIGNKKDQIEQHENKAIDLVAARAAMTAVVQTCIRDQMKVLQQLRVNMEAAGQGVCGCLRAEGKAKVLHAEVTVLENSARVWKEKIKDIEKKSNAMKMELENQKLEGRDALNNLKQLLGIVSIKEITDEIRDRFQNSSLEETETHLADKNAQLSCLTTASASEIREYQESQKHLARLRDSLQELQRKVNSHLLDLQEVKNRWLPHMTRLVANISDRFSDFMAQMGYAGEVGLIEKDEDFDSYGIDIKVKFRDEQPLQQLTAQHQSGGERAVSTALYLLALQSLTAAPFRCVDEINQGMDKINERKILEMLMETEKSQECSQYFFVTPKLLQNLDYKGHVNIMVVLNSPTTLSHRRFTIKRILKRKEEIERRRSKKKGTKGV